MQIQNFAVFFSKCTQQIIRIRFFVYPETIKGSYAGIILPGHRVSEFDLQVSKFALFRNVRHVSAISPEIIKVLKPDSQAAHS